ncbi:MAG: DUF4389 domain-containing protein [Candidatus Aegiribacteria sp.]|nr:DUF4389 domain-containing protein [Candidatus Aegiribacteria sp.]
MEERNGEKRDYTDDLMRGLFMIIFFVAARFVAVLVVFIALFQFICTLITRKPNDNVKDFGKDLSLYAAEIIEFLSYNTDRKPWPFSPGSEAEPENPEPSVK